MIEKDHVNNDQYVNICLQKGKSGDHGLVLTLFSKICEHDFYQVMTVISPIIGTKFPNDILHFSTLCIGCILLPHLGNST